MNGAAVGVERTLFVQINTIPVFMLIQSACQSCWESQCINRVDDPAEPADDGGSNTEGDTSMAVSLLAADPQAPPRMLAE